MPQVLLVQARRPYERTLRIWIPVLPVVLVLLPVLLLAALAAVVACLVLRVSVVRAFATGWHIVAALPGTQVDLEQGRSAVLVTIR